MRRKWALRFVPSSSDHNDFIRKVEKYQNSLLAQSQEHNEEASEQAEAISDLLSKAPYYAINQEFDRLKGDRKHDFPWYKPSGPNSIADMAERFGYGAEYEVFYSQYSQIMHASSQLDNVKFANGSITFEPIRKLDRLRPILNVGIGISIKAFKTVLNKYRPQEIENFSKKYAKDWRDAFLSIKDVTYKVNHETLDF